MVQRVVTLLLRDGVHDILELSEGPQLRAGSQKQVVTFAAEDLLDPVTRGTLFVAKAARGSPAKTRCHLRTEHQSGSYR
jgi:hypothetical protein